MQGRRDVRVGVESDCDARVSEALLYDFRVLARLERAWVQAYFALLLCCVMEAHSPYSCQNERQPSIPASCASASKWGRMLIAPWAAAARATSNRSSSIWTPRLLRCSTS